MVGFPSSESPNFQGKTLFSGCYLCVFGGCNQLGQQFYSPKKKWERDEPNNMAMFLSLPCILFSCPNHLSMDFSGSNVKGGIGSM